MKIYITRHGQVLPAKSYGDVQFPAGDPPLTEVGRKQAGHLGAYLKHLGFCGKIYSSPYRRTLETAEIIAEHTDSEIIPWVPMREIMKTHEAAEEFCGMTSDEMIEMFPHVVKEIKLPYPWWEKKQDSEEDVLKRVGTGFSELMPEEDVLFVGHGASAGHMIRYLNIPSKKGMRFFNCSLSVLDTENPKNSKYLDYAHLPYLLRGENAVMLADREREHMEAVMKRPIEIPEDVQKSCGLKVLHIGDTTSVTYPYYEKLIAETKPDIIIHTGDLADEIKAGRMIGTREEYSECVERLGQILKASGAEKIYVVPGNNDLPDVIAEKLPFADIVHPDTQMEIGGVTCTLTHMRQEIQTKSEWYLYGHGLTGETWSTEQNEPFGECRFNVMWGSYLYVLPERKIISFQRPEE